MTSAHEHLWMDSRPLLAVHGYDRTDPGPWDAAAATEARWNPGSHPDNYDLTDAAACGHRARAISSGPADGRWWSSRRHRSVATRFAFARSPNGPASTWCSAPVSTSRPAHEPWVAAATEATIAERLIDEAERGIGDTGIRPGIFGEIGTSNPVTPGERRVLRAVAAAASATGLAISVHLHPWGLEGPAVLDELEAAGADPQRVILGHVSTAFDRPDVLAALLDRGATLGFDLFGFDHSLLGAGRWPPSDRDVAMRVAALVESGHAERIVLGQDVGVRTRLRRWGGWGYAHLLEHVVPLLAELGVAERAVRTMLVDNPARLLACRAMNAPATGPGSALTRLSPSLWWYRDTCNVYVWTPGSRRS